MLRWNGIAAAVALLTAATGVVCPGQTPGGDPAAKLITVTGRVSVLRDSIPWALDVGDTVKPHQVIVTGPDGFAVFQVSDGSRFEVYPNSRVTFRDNPGDWRDLLELMLGRVKVHIQKALGGQPNPNKVHTPTAIISVRGTVFDVSVEDGDTTLVVVEEGQVQVQHRLLPFSAPKLLNEGEWVRVYKDQPLARKSVDRGGVIRAALRAVSEAIYAGMTQPSRGGTMPPAGGGGSSGGGLPGDHDPNKPPSSGGGSGGGTTPPSNPPAPPPPGQ